MRLPIVLFINQLMRKGKKTSVFQDEDEDFSLLNDILSYCKSLKSFCRLKSRVKHKLAAYEFRLFLRPSQVHC